MKRKLLSLLLSLAMLASLLVVPAMAAEPTFSDLGDHWAKATIEKWAGRGIVKGDENGKFRPDDNISRAEIATVMDNLMGYQTQAENTFKDLAADAWYASAILSANAAGIIKGAGDAVRPTDMITRQEVAVMMTRVLDISGGMIPVDTYSDVTDIAPWALDAMNAMVAKGYVKGNAGKLLPTANITRAEVITILDNVFAGYYAKAETVTGDVVGSAVVNVPGVTLKNMKISGDLIVAEGVGTGDLTLNNVTVAGKVIVRGCGVESLHIVGNSKIANLHLAKGDGAVRVVTEGNAEVTVTYIDDGKDDVIIEGTFGTVSVDTDAPVTFKNAKVDTVTATANGVNLTVDKNSKVTTVATKGENTQLTVAGTVANVAATKEATGLSLNVAKGGTAANVTTAAAGSTVTNEGKVGALSVAKDADTKYVAGEGTKLPKLTAEDKTNLTATTVAAEAAKVAAEKAAADKAAADALAAAATTDSEKAFAAEAKAAAEKAAAEAAKAQDAAKKQDEKIQNDANKGVVEKPVTPPTISDGGAVTVPDAKPLPPSGGSTGDGGWTPPAPTTITVNNAADLTAALANSQYTTVTVGTSMTIAADATVRAGAMLIINTDVTLTVAESATLTVDGNLTIANSATLNVIGNIVGEGTLTNNGGTCADTVIDAAELTWALLTDDVTKIIISGTIGSAEAYDTYTVDRPVTITGGKVFGSFVVTADDVTFDNVDITNKGGVSTSADRNAINAYCKTLTVKNCGFTSGAEFANGIVIFPSATGVTYTITGNTFTGYKNGVTGWSTTGVLISSGYVMSGKTFFGVNATSAETTMDNAKDLAIIAGNTFADCKNDYTRNTYKDAPSGAIYCTANSSTSNFRLQYAAASAKFYVTGNLTMDATINDTAADWIIKSGSELIINKDVTLTIPAGKTLTNNGTLTIAKGATLVNNGTLVHNGEIECLGTITGNTALSSTTKQTYATLENAITATNEWGNVVLLGDVAGDHNINKAITLKGNGHVFSGNVTVTTTGDIKSSTIENAVFTNTVKISGQTAPVFTECTFNAATYAVELGGNELRIVGNYGGTGLNWVVEALNTAIGGKKVLINLDSAVAVRYGMPAQSTPDVIGASDAPKADVVFAKSWAIGNGTSANYTVTVPATYTMTIKSGVTLTIATSSTLINAGTITNNGILVNSGTIFNDGTINGSGTGSDSGTISALACASVAVVDGTDGFTPVTTPVIGQKLSANLTMNDSSVIGTYPVNADVTYKWGYTDGDSVLGTEPTYTVTSDNAGKTLKLTATYKATAAKTWTASAVIATTVTAVAKPIWSNTETPNAAQVNEMMTALWAADPSTVQGIPVKNVFSATGTTLTINKANVTAGIKQWIKTQWGNTSVPVALTLDNATGVTGDVNWSGASLAWIDLAAVTGTTATATLSNGAVVTFAIAHDTVAPTVAVTEAEGVATLTFSEPLYTKEGDVLTLIDGSATAQGNPVTNEALTAEGYTIVGATEITNLYVKNDGTSNVWKFTFNSAAQGDGMSYNKLLCDASGNEAGYLTARRTTTWDGAAAHGAWLVTFEKTATPDVTAPTLENATLTGSGAKLTLTVDAADAGELASVEVDHSLEGKFPEFTLDAKNWSFTDEGSGLGVEVVYDATEQKWTATFNEVASALIRKEATSGEMTFYFSIKDKAGNQFGSMYTVTADMTKVLAVPAWVPTGVATPVWNNAETPNAAQVNEMMTALWAANPSTVQGIDVKNVFSYANSTLTINKPNVTDGIKQWITTQWGGTSVPVALTLDNTTGVTGDANWSGAILAWIDLATVTGTTATATLSNGAVVTFTIAVTPAD